MLCTEIVGVYFENQRSINIMGEQNLHFINVKACRTYWSHYGLKCYDLSWYWCSYRTGELQCKTVSNFQCYGCDTCYAVLIHLHRHLSRHGRWWIAIRRSERTRKPYKIGLGEELLCSPSDLQFLCWTSWWFVADSDTNAIVTCFASRLSYWVLDHGLPHSLQPCARIVPYIRTWPNSSVILSYSVILPFHPTLYEWLTSS
jgi:hypothetical protein